MHIVLSPVFQMFVAVLKGSEERIQSNRKGDTR